MIWNTSKYLLRIGTFLPRQRMIGYIEWTHIRDVLHRYDINCVLDVGASRGQYARSLRRIGYKGFICSFEPIPQEFESLRKVMQNDPKWRGFNMALGSEDTEQVFHVAVDFPEASSFLQHKDHAAKMRDINVPVKRLDSVFEEAISAISEPRIFLKIDTQGYDLEVVKGAEQSILQVICLQSEISVSPIYDKTPHYLAALEIYEGLGFQLAGLFEVLRNQSLATIIEMNCLMVHPEYVT